LLDHFDLITSRVTLRGLTCNRIIFNLITLIWSLFCSFNVKHYSVVWP